jgi:altronate dehydratase
VSGAVLLVGLGCEVIQFHRLKADYGIAGNAEFDSFTIQDVDGTLSILWSDATSLALRPGGWKATVLANPKWRE